MFVRVKKIGAYEYLYLVENAREGGRHVQRRSIVLSNYYRGELAELRRVSAGPDLVFASCGERPVAAM